MNNKFAPHHFMAFAGLMVWLLWSRLIGINYDNGLHLHPDERWLMMLLDRIHFFDQLDPNFFAYGALPIYVLKAVVQGLDALIGTHFDNYDQALFVGRFLVSGIDILMAGLVFLIARFLTGRTRTGWLASLSYSLFFFMIQNSNFFIVDHFLALFLTLTFWQSLNYLQQQSFKRLTWIGLAFGLAISSKITAVVVGPALLIMLLAATHTQSFQQNWTRIKFIWHLLLSGFWIGLVSLLTFICTNPYAVISHQQFIKEVIAQLSMNSDPYVFPYTLQYVATTPYWYYLKNIFWWGIGPISSLLAILGFGTLLMRVISDVRQGDRPQIVSLFQHPILLTLVFYASYFLVLGRSAVKFMRYMQPMYVILAVAAGVGIGWLLENKAVDRTIRRAVVWIFILSMGVWTLSFVSIYTRPHPRIAATEWMNANLSQGATLAVEHWDDRLPIYSTKVFNFEELPIYEVPDDQTKWSSIEKQLDNSDYLILASNRLWVPLPKLADCDTHKKCYPLTADYYNELLSGSLQFEKVQEFTNYPKLALPFGTVIINDDFADESFTVYDHPKVMIFQNTKKSDSSL